jgi:CpeT protein
MKTVFLFIFSLICSLASAQGKKITADDMKNLATFMAGEFSSGEQSKADTSYFHIMLRMKPIWRESTDGYWFYVEQSLASKQEKPYRQRVYHLYRQDDLTAVSKVYEIKDPLKYAGGWKDTLKLASLKKDSLIDRQGCAIFLNKTGKEIYLGATPGKECLSTLRGAAYATSEVRIMKDKILSWDRGWDKNDKQVWGAEKGGYVFMKQKDYDL